MIIFAHHTLIITMQLLFTSLRRWSLSLIAITGISCSLSAQTHIDEIQPDRPDHSEGTSVLAPHHFQVEWGTGFTSAGHNMGLMLRYGLLSDWELRLEGLLQCPHHSVLQLTDLTLSSKLSLFSGEGWIPAMTLVGYLNYAPQEMPRRLTGDLLLALEQELTSDLTFTCNVGSSEGMQHLLLTAELGYAFNERFSSFIEYYGNFSPTEHGCDLGLSYSLTPNFIIDLSAGRTFATQGGMNYASLGASYRL